ncbi:acyl-CoA dehydrogenase family protein [Roseinatronobacter alkalisoli]|uniref:Acyl-CoA dehydrogenase family protein n=1 Tax=Roseinatronobacter alkalisoli TaxID=3028235 RepID=A0ABT5T3E5_9RHOB|nr:acyl-CoA dehydrogenase family protein [Roseinatronobacter sp. HJB301]MDD7969529.1 acyl-CoA dehydrogenase family protein [Roseinatronobacter sp. HJB301]
MLPFAAPVDDILWSLEFAGAARIPDWDGTLTAEITRHFAAFAQGRIAPLDEAGDRQGCRLHNGRVFMPDGFDAVFRDLADDGWLGLTAPEEFGGQGMGAAVQAATSEIFSGACHSLQMVTGLVPGAIRLLMHFGSADQQARFIPPLVSGDWLATMCLTEPGAGSDLSAIRTKAESTAQGWRVTGEKIFISGGDQNLSGNILHLVLARTGPDGTRDLGLFACPAVLADGVRNAVSVTRIEEKMGLHASPTCQMAFDSAQGELIGAPGQGLAAMFTLMNHARLDVALQGVAHAARAHAVASAYAAGRVQGRGADGQAVTLDQHADVRRMIDEADALALSARALTHSALVALETGNQALADFLTPVAKVCGSDAGTQAAELAVQVLGGYGYLHEYRVEQTYRDARICAIYEGANGIHAATLATRGLSHGGGVQADAFAAWIGQIADTLNGDILHDALREWTDLRGVTASAPRDIAPLFMQVTIALAELGFWLRVADDDATPVRICALAKGRCSLLPGQIAHLAAQARIMVQLAGGGA